MVSHINRTETDGVRNSLLRRIFGPKREEVKAGWRKLHNEKLYNLYSSQDDIGVIKSEGMGWVSNVARMGEMRNTYKIFVWKPEGKT
jgi:hypothetical protein